MTPAEWLMGSDVGISSQSIWTVMVCGVPASTRCDFLSGYNVPHDPDDFGRCYRLLKAFPEWRKRLSEVAVALPKWKPMVDHWDEMERLYERDLPTGKCHELYELMQWLEDEGWILDGWVKTGSNSWKRDESHA